MKTETGVFRLRGIGVTLLICENQVLMNDSMIRLHKKHCKNPDCPAKRIKYECEEAEK